MTDHPPEGRFVGAEHRFPVRVYFEDTDVSGVVYHANYLRYLERARSDILRLIGIDHGAALAAGEGAYAVAALGIRYRAPARLDDALVVRSRLATMRAASMDIHQTVRRGETILAEAEVTMAMVGPSGRPRRQPAAWVAAFAGVSDADVDEESR